MTDFRKLRVDLWHTGGIVRRIILVNAIIFLVLGLWHVFNLLALNSSASDDTFTNNYLAVPGNFLSLLYRPWTLITYQFTHASVSHIFFNMLVLWSFATIYNDVVGERRLLGTYLMGSIVGAFIFVLACTLVPAFSNSGTNYTLIGASAGVMAIMVTTATVAPFYTINLILIGPVKLVYVVLVYIALDFLFLASSNGGGHFSHLGGALYGFAFARLSTRQVDIQGWLDSFLNRNFLNRGSGVRLSRTHTVSEAGMSSNSKNKPVTQADIDKILDKINTSGYNSLSAKEKDQLFRAHRND